MSAQADSSFQSLGTPDLSLGSLVSGISTPAKSFRVSSASSHTTAPSSAPISTPSPPRAPIRRKGDEATPVAIRRHIASREDDDEQASDPLNTSRKEDSWEGDLGTPLNTRGKRSKSNASNAKGNNLTLRDQEKHIDNLKKENFNIKLKVHFLEERLAQLAPDQVEAALKQNINLKIEVQQRGMELKKVRKLVLELENELQRIQRGDVARTSRERELEALLEKRERDLRRRLSSEHGQDDDGALREAEERNAELEEELENVRSLLEENMDELERLKDIVEQRGEDSHGGDGGRRIAELEEEINDLKAALEEHADALAQHEEDKEEILDQNEALRLQIEDLDRRRDAENIERSESRAMILEERESREAIEDDLNVLRDKLAAASIEIQQKDDELSFKSQEISELVTEHRSILDDVEGEWKGEVDEAKTQIEELRDALAERDAESEELRMQVTELESNTNALHDKFEAALAHLEQEAEEKDEEIALANREIEQLGHRIYELEEDAEELKRINDRAREDDMIERERLEALTAALKEKVAHLKSDLQEATTLYEQSNQDIHAHRARQEELAQHVEDLVGEVQMEREARERTEAELDKSHRDFESEMRRSRRTYEAHEASAQSAQTELARAQALLSQREADLAAIQAALTAQEAAAKSQGENATTARFSLQLEADRLKRDLERLEDELARVRKELHERETRMRERDGVIDTLHTENRELSAQLAIQTQARLNATEKLDLVQSSLSTAETDVASLRARAQELEQRLSKDQRSLLSAENQYRDQLTERNTLLLTIYQYMDKILGVDKTPKKGGQAETKPYTNFGIFHDNLITRLKSLSQIQVDFEKRTKVAEARYTEKLGEIRKSLDHRWRQLDKFENSVKQCADAKSTMRRKLSTKEGELESAKTTLSDLTAQLAILKRPATGDSNEVKAAMIRANNAERRLANAQNQLAAAEEKMSAMNQKTTAADSKWEARVKEYETRLRAAEEKVKRERQGYKERVLELENQIKSLQRQRELADKRNQQLAEIEAKVPQKSASPAR
jgi:chromosome segregation ATPase